VIGPRAAVVVLASVALAGGIARAADGGTGDATTLTADAGPLFTAADGGAAAGPVTEPPPPKAVAPLVTQVFEQPFPFCRNARYPLTPEEHKWCALLSKDDTRCPELAKACGLGATARFEGNKEARAHAARPWQVPVSPLSIRIILWALLAAGVGFIIYQIVRHAIAQGPIDRDRLRDETEAVVDHAAAAAARQIETDVERLLASASAAAAAGDFRRAIDDAYAALLRKLEGNGVVRVEPHQTNGDHVRDVGRKLPAMRPRMQAVVETVEGVQFGGEPPEEARYRSVLTGVLSLLGERIAGALPLLITLTTLGVVAGGCGVDRDQWDRSPSGRAGVVDLLLRYGFDARERLLSLTKVDATVAELVILPAATVEQEDWVALGDWAAQGGTLIIAGGDRDLPAWIGVKVVDDKTGPASATPSKHAAPPPMSMSSVALAPDGLEVPEEQGNRLPRLAASVPGDHQVIVAATAMSEPDEVAPAAILVRGKSVYALERSYDGGGGAIVLADDRLFTNASLLVGDNARLMVELVRTGGRRVDVAGELTGLVSTSPLTSVQRGRLAPALLQLSLLVLLFFVYKGAHFGRPVDPVVSRRRAFSQHARAIGLQYARGRAARHALSVYGSYALERMRERLRLASGKGLGAVAEEVAARSGRPLGDVMRVLLEAKPVEGPIGMGSGAGAANDLATIREIATLLATTGGSGERTGPQTKA
jgi:hypothetical protein